MYVPKWHASYTENIDYLHHKEMTHIMNQIYALFTLQPKWHACYTKQENNK